MAAHATIALNPFEGAYADKESGVYMNDTEILTMSKEYIVDDSSQYVRNLAPPLLTLSSTRIRDAVLLTVRFTAPLKMLGDFRVKLLFLFILFN